jgi:hypothetical protein
MRPRFAVWQENWRAWTPPLVLVVLGFGALALYQIRYSGRVEALDSRLEETRGRASALAARRAELDGAVRRAEANRQALAALYQGPLGPERDRLTRIIAEVKQLAARAGMRPDAISYPVEEIKDYSLVKKSVVFGVGGSYGELRQLINFLELSSSFLTLEQVSLSEAAGENLAIRLQIATLFADERPRPERRPVRRPKKPAATPTRASEEGP